MQEQERKCNDYINLMHARTEKQAEIMKKIEKDGVCPFCYENITTYHTGPILKETDWWTVIENFAPYKGTHVQLVIIYRHHIEKFSDIQAAAASELTCIMKWVENEYAITSGALFCRFGNTEFTGGSVNHLHVQFIVGNSSRNSNESTELKVKLGYYTEDSN